MPIGIYHVVLRGNKNEKEGKYCNLKEFQKSVHS